MTSQINPNNIDGNYPVPGVDNNSQGFRDNFTNIKTNFQYTEDEINDLQTKALLKAALYGQTLDNNMSDNLIYAARIRDFSSVKVSAGTTGSIAIDYSAGHYQSINMLGSVSLSFINFPPSGSYGLMRIQFHVTNTAYTLQLPADVSLGLSGIQGISPGTAGVSNTITFGTTGYYEFAFGSSDGGSTITLFDLNRALTNFTAGNLQSADVTATNNITAGNTVTGAEISSSGNISATGTVTAGAVSVGSLGNVTGGNVVAINSFSTTGSVIAGNVSAFITASAGTTSVAPARVTPGSLLIVPQTGAIELDSSVFYATPLGGTSANRGVWPAQHVITVPTGGRVLTQDTSAQSVFNSPANGSITTTSDTTYEFEAYYVITNDAAPSTAHSVSLLFNYTGSLSGLSYIADVTTSSSSPTAGATTISRSHGITVSALQITPAGTTINNETITVHLRGLMRVSTVGVLTPQIQYNSNAPGGTSTVTENSWFRLAAWGNSTMTSVGNWS